MASMIAGGILALIGVLIGAAIVSASKKSTE